MSGKNKKNKSSGAGYTLSQEDLNAIQMHFDFFNGESYRRMAAENEKFAIPRGVIRKREKAAKAYLPALYKQFQTSYKKSEIRELFLYSVVIPVDILGKIESSDYLIIGAAIWLLDYFKENDITGRLKTLLPANPKSRDNYDLPYFADSVHPAHLLTGCLRC